MTLSWIFTAAMIVKDIVYEKERRLKEVMKVMGLGNTVHWVSWFITSFSMMLVSVLLLVTVLKVAVVHHTSSLQLSFIIGVCHDKLLLSAIHVYINAVNMFKLIPQQHCSVCR